MIILNIPRNKFYPKELDFWLDEQLGQRFFFNDKDTQSNMIKKFEISNLNWAFGFSTDDHLFFCFRTNELAVLFNLTWGGSYDL